MRARNMHLIQITFSSLVVALSSGCAPEMESDQISVELQAKSPQPVYISAKRVSSDCGVEFVPEALPGFAEAAGVPRKEMSDRVAGFLATGAEREQVDTDKARVSPGFVLIEPGSVKKSFLINNDKEVVATFEGDNYIGFSQLLSNGNRLASAHARSEVFADGGGDRGCIEEFTPDGQLLWRMNLNTDNYIHHHDVLDLDNGNVLAIVWDRVSAGEAVSQGRNPDNVAESGDFWYGGVIEVDPYTLEIVWEWSARHHMVQDFDAGKANFGVVADHPELLDINRFRRSPQDGTISADWTHFNAMDYNPALDQILLSSNYLSEVYVIDHSTTPQESAGHSGGRYGKGGDFLYRWGNPENYARGDGDDRRLFHQHDVQWIDRGLPGAGNILVFNNGSGKLRPYSTVVEFAPAIHAGGSYALADGAPYGPAELVWEYNPPPPERFFSFFISGAQRLANGNTLIDQGAGAKLREVTVSGEIVWEYTYADDLEGPHMLFRANRYPADHPGVLALLGQ